VRALRVLGVALSMEGQPRKGSELLLKAGALSWRDDVTQLWLIRQAVEQRNYPTATQRIDAMLRRRRNVDQMLALLHRLSAVPEVQPEVIERLAEQPNWRARFFSNVKELPKEVVTSHAALISALQKREGSVSRAEVAPFVHYLVSIGEVGLARRVWMDAISPGRRALAHGIYDGDFTEDPNADSDQPRYPFEWQFDSSSGAFASVGTPPMLIGENALAVKSVDGSEARVARQLVILGPGQHQLRYSAVAGEELRPEAFEWRVSCAMNGKRLPTRVLSGRAVGASRASTADFAVPPNCPAQWVELVALGSENAVAADAWFDHVSVR
jgi:hypothetical protein